jgi:hypothetical protein
MNTNRMKESKDHTSHYWIRHKEGYLFCGVCKKKQDTATQGMSKE